MGWVQQPQTRPRNSVTLKDVTSPALLAPVPAPWTLKGRGFVFLYRFSNAFVQEQGAIPALLQERFVGGVGAVMLLDYQQSPVGPYQELLFIPGQLHGLTGPHPMVTQIYVSSLSSVVSGWHNWGLPKERAEFQASPERWQVSRGGEQVADFHLRSEGPLVPFVSSVFPAHLRTLMQLYGRQLVFTAPEARGLVRPARLMSSSSNMEAFPDLSAVRPFAGFELTRFRMVFPVPERQLIPWS